MQQAQNDQLAAGLKELHDEVLTFAEILRREAAADGDVRLESDQEE